jgi:mono/diheme cytochrome c family protein
MRNTVKVAIVAIASMLLVGGGTGYALAGHSSPRTTLAAAALPTGTYKIKTTLNTKQEVPRPKGTTTATGSFTGTLKITTAAKASLTFRLTYARLTGPGLAAHVHLGAAGKPGKIAVALCAPCSSGAHGTKPVSVAAAQAMISGKAYVNVHTKTNPAGEIRGQVKATTSGGGASDNPYANIVVTQTSALVAQGKSLSTKFSCEGCHTIDGSQSSGPTWKGLAGRNVKLTNGKTVKATDGYLIWSIEQPDAEIVAGYSSGIMTTAIGNISLAQAKALTAYIKSVK